MKEIHGDLFTADECSVAELMRLTGFTRARCRKIKADGLVIREHGNKGRKRNTTVLTGYEEKIDSLLLRGIRNSSVCMEAIAKEGYEGGISTVKAYIKEHLDLMPAERKIKAVQGNRGQRYTTGRGEAYQMDWGFINVECVDDTRWKACCLAFVCHHCGYRHIEFFASAKQENLFIGMLHAFEDTGKACKIVCVNGKCYCKEGDTADDQEKHKGKGCHRPDTRPAGPAWDDAGGAVWCRGAGEEAYSPAAEQGA